MDGWDISQSTRNARAPGGAKNISINIDIDMVILENIDIDMDFLENNDIDKGILRNIDIN